MYSSIKRPKCKCGCGKAQTISCMGYNYNCLPPDLKEKVGEKKKLQQKRLNAKRYASVKLRAEKYKEDNEQEFWFRARRLQMTDHCSECGRSTNKDNDKYWKWSVCHIVPKSLVPSVATNYHNWLELCQDHHSEFDSTFEKASKMKCFHEARLKFSYFKDLIPNEELRKVNPYLLKDQSSEPQE